jgi:translation elongation factor EF-Ts
MAKVEAVILNRMITDETDRMAADGVVAFKSVQDKAHVADFGAFLDFVISGERRDMLTSAVRQEAVRAFLAESGQLPPGVAMNSIVKVNVRKG